MIKIPISIKNSFDRIHRLLAKSRIASKACACIRNQVNCVIGYHLGESCNPFKNGEFKVVDAIAPLCNTFVDVGAYTGEWAKYFLSIKKCQAHLFEPSKACFKLLSVNFPEGENAKLYNVPLSDAAEDITFIEGPNLDQGSSALETYQENRKGSIFYEARTSTLDGLFIDTDLIIDYLKIDAEGYDLKVLKGSVSLLKAKRIRHIQFEYNSQWIGSGSSLKEALFFLDDLGYEVFLIRSTGLHSINYDFWGDYYRYSNFFTLPKEDREKIALLTRERI